MKALFRLAATAILTLTISTLLADCGCQSFELGFGWRRDNLDWKSVIEASSRDSAASGAEADSHFDFHKIHSYSANGKAKFVGSEYYVRLDADYSWTEKGRGNEFLRVMDPTFPTFSSDMHNPVKRRSELYDFSGAVGYPLGFFCCRLNVIPLIGFSYHRQRLRVKGEEQFFSGAAPDIFIPASDDCSGCCCCDSLSSDDVFFGYSGSFDFCGSFHPNKRTSSYRFTWYGPFVGVDIGYALDSVWSLWGEFEYHFGRAHQKRNSDIGFGFLDGYHHEGYAQGFKGTVGTTYVLCNEWFGGVYVDYIWWYAKQHHDSLKWKSVGIYTTLGYMY